VLTGLISSFIQKARSSKHFLLFAVDVINMSVAPSDSLSSSGKKKSRPGKSQRLASRGLTSEASARTAPSSMSGAAAFAAAAQSDPVPQPGKFPIVFPSGAGEPTRDAAFCYDGNGLGQIVSDLPGRFTANSRYAEFSAHAEMSSDDFETRLSQSFYLGLAQQTVHAHVNMGLPMGDFSPIASTDVVNFSSVRSILTQFGEFSADSLGTRYLLEDYEGHVKACVRAAGRSRNDKPDRVGQTFWLPTSSSDKRTKLLVARALADYISPFGVIPKVEQLAECVFQRTSDVWEGIKGMIGDSTSPGGTVLKDQFDFLFASYATEQAFVDGVGAPARRRALQALGFNWNTPSAGDLSWGGNPKQLFSAMADELARSRATFSKFFSSSSGLANRAVAMGSGAQLSQVKSNDGVFLVKSMLAQAAPEYSLLACFPCSCVLRDVVEFRVVLTTSINVSQRATEFTQLDWL